MINRIAGLHHSVTTDQGIVGLRGEALVDVVGPPLPDDVPESVDFVISCRQTGTILLHSPAKQSFWLTYIKGGQPVVLDVQLGLSILFSVSPSGLYFCIVDSERAYVFSVPDKCPAVLHPSAIIPATWNDSVGLTISDDGFSLLFCRSSLVRLSPQSLTHVIPLPITVISVSPLLSSAILIDQNSKFYSSELISSGGKPAGLRLSEIVCNGMSDISCGPITSMGGTSSLFWVNRGSGAVVIAIYEGKCVTHYVDRPVSSALIHDGRLTMVTDSDMISTEESLPLTELLSSHIEYESPRLVLFDLPTQEPPLMDDQTPPPLIADPIVADPPYSLIFSDKSHISEESHLLWSAPKKPPPTTKPDGKILFRNVRSSGYSAPPQVQRLGQTPTQARRAREAAQAAKASRPQQPQTQLGWPPYFADTEACFTQERIYQSDGVPLGETSGPSGFGQPVSLEYSPDGSYLLAGWRGGQVLVSQPLKPHRIQSGAVVIPGRNSAPLATLTCGPLNSTLIGTKWSRSGRLMVSGTDQGLVSVWDMERIQRRDSGSNKPLHQLNVVRPPKQQVPRSASRHATQTVSTLLSKSNTPQCTTLQAQSSAPPSPLSGIGFLYNDRLIVTSNGQQLWLWGLDIRQRVANDLSRQITGNTMTRLSRWTIQQGNISAIDSSVMGTVVALATSARDVSLLDYAGGSVVETLRIPQAHSRAISSVQLPHLATGEGTASRTILPPGADNMLLTSGMDGYVRIWDVRCGSLAATCFGSHESSRVPSVAVWAHPGLEVAVVDGVFSRVCIYDIRNPNTALSTISLSNQPFLLAGSPAYPSLSICDVTGGITMWSGIGGW